jgi:SAM-dependent methyltransferase
MSYACPLCLEQAELTGESLGGYALYRCASCRHTYAPASFGREVDYDALYGGGEYLREQVEPIVSGRHAFADLPPYQAFFRRVRGSAGLLDVGCGAGRFLLAAQRHGWDACGIDVSRRAVDAARAAGLSVECADVEETLTCGRHFDVVTAFDVLEHVADPVKVLRQLGACASGGTVFVTVPNWDCALFHGTANPEWLPPVHMQFFTLASLRACAERVGLKLRGCGIVYSEPCPPGLAALRWQLRRLRGRSLHPAQLWLKASA